MSHIHYCFMLISFEIKPKRHLYCGIYDTEKIPDKKYTF